MSGIRINCIIYNNDNDNIVFSFLATTIIITMKYVMLYGGTVPSPQRVVNNY